MHQRERYYQLDDIKQVDAEQRSPISSAYSLHDFNTCISLLCQNWTYCNSLLSGLREDHITKFQLVQILPHARLLTGTRKHEHEHISPILRSLHCLPIPEIIDFKLLLLTFKSLNDV